MNDFKTQVNCKVHKSDYLEVAYTAPYKGLTSACVQIVNTRTGEVGGVVIDREQAKEICEALKGMFNF